MHTNPNTPPMEWREVAIAEVSELIYLLRNQPDFSPTDLRDRLAGLSEYLELQPWIDVPCNYN